MALRPRCPLKETSSNFDSRKKPANTKPGLRPWPGRRLPDELRPENVGRLSEALAEGVRDPEFERLVQRIDTGPIHPGNKVNVFCNGGEALATVP